MNATEAQTSTSKLSDVLAALGTRDQFIVWESRPNPKPNGKPLKIPLDKARLKASDSSDPANWYSASQAFAIVDLFNQTVTPIEGSARYGVGFVLTEQDPFFCLDIDNCLQANGTLSQLALDLCEQLSGAAVEVSHSGRGLHIWGTADPMPPHGCRNTKLGIEFYSTKRFIALGHLDSARGSIIDCTGALNTLLQAHFSGTTQTPGLDTSAWTTAPCEGWDGETDDTALIEHAKQARPSAKTIFGDSATFTQLWEADPEALAIAFPSQLLENPYDASAADFSLATRLAFWAGKDCERIRQLMLQSDLEREKWNREDYLVRTILNAVAVQTSVHVRGAATTTQKGEATATEIPRNIKEGGEVDLAHLIEDKYKDLLCFTPNSLGWFYREKEKLWKRDPDALAIRERIRTWIILTPKLKRGANVRGVLYLLESALSMTAAWDSDPLLCGLPNDTVLDLKTGKARAATSDDRISRRLGFVPESGLPTRWLQFLNETVDPNDSAATVQFLQSFCVYLLTGYTRERKFLFLSGSGGNGKSVFLDTLAAVLGDYAISLPTDALLGDRQQHRQWLTLCDGPRLAYVSEVEPGVRWRVGDLKDLTGGGTVSANHMRQETYTFQPAVKILIAGNDKPGLSRVDPAIRDRLVLLEFNRRPARPDRHLVETLRAEGGKILSWMLAAMPGYLQNGLAAIPASAQESTRGYLQDERSGPQILDSRLSEILVPVQAARSSAAGSKYTTSGVRRSSARCRRLAL